MSVVGVEAAADRLGLSAVRVRQLASAGAIPAVKVSNAWVFNSSDLDAAPARKRVVGRPMSPLMAWAVLWAREGRECIGLEPYAASRARRYVQRDFDSLWPRLARRARLQPMFAHPSHIDRIEDDRLLVRGGASAAAHYEAGLVVPGDAEAYVHVRDVDQVIVTHGLIEAAGEPNVFLRIVDDAAWPFEREERIAPKSVVAVDLLERSRGPDRLRAAARELAR